MAIRVTIDAFSGRQNPSFELTGKAEANAIKMLRRPRSQKRERIRSLPPATLGYRGMVVEQLGRLSGGLPRTFRVANGDVFAGRAPHRASDPAFEDFVCGSTGPLRRLRLGPDFPLDLVREIARLNEIRLRYPWPKWGWPLRNPCECAPLYEPAWWNVSARQPYNNCYNYATNYRTNTFAQPGRAAGAMYTALTCAAVRPAAVADELIDSPAANNKCPGEGHLVALVVWPSGDYHWYRKGRNGYWSHKPGGTAATNLDNSGNLIADPRTADRGPYTNFCTFMVVMHGHIRIS